MLKFLIDKLKESSGPLKQVRLVVGDVIEEVVDLAGHYIRKLRNSPAPAVPDVISPEIPQTPSDSPEQVVPQKKKSPQQSAASKPAKPAARSKKSSAAAAKKNKTAKKTEPPRTIDVPPELAAALDNTANRRKQEFKVLSILWDARNRNMGGMSAKALSEHGTNLGLAIRHENIRKVIKMRLSNYVEILHEHGDRASINHYRLNDEGIDYFNKTFLS